MQMIKTAKIKLGKAVPALALMLGTGFATKACFLWFHQPKIPDQLKKPQGKY